MKKLEFEEIKEVLIETAKERKITFNQVAEIYKLSITLRSNYEAANVLNKEKMLKDVRDFNGGKCLFYPDENKAYLKLNKRMEYVYISEREKDNTYFSLNLLEMAQVVLKIDFYETLLSLIYKTGTLTVENTWIEKQRNIYKDNITKVKDTRTFWIINITKDYEILVGIANNNLKRGWVNSIEIDGETCPYFTISNKYFSEKIGKYESSAWSSLLYLETIGLIEKIEPEEIANKSPKKLPKKFNKSIGIYRIVEATDYVISEAIEKINILSSFSITKSNITKSKIEKLRKNDYL